MQFDRTLKIQSAASLHCCLLGGFSLSRGNRTLTAARIQLRRGRDLIKLLALAPNHRLHREEVLEMLWPDRDPDAAAHSLSQTLYCLRPGLAELDLSARIQFEGDCLVFSAEGGISTDVEDFEQSARSALGHTGPLDSQTAASCQDAIVAYAGDLLPEDGPSELFYRRREELRQLYQSLLIELADYNLEAQEYLPAIDALQKAITVDPNLEEVHTRLMRAYALSGQRQAALHQYQILEEALRRDLDVDPAPESRQLRNQIVDGTLAPQQQAFDWLFKPRHNLPAQISSFIGRESEVDEVRSLIRTHRLVTLTGAGGVGKTRLAITAAEGLLADFSQGVLWVELAVRSDPEGVAKAVLGVLRLPAQDQRQDIDQLVDYLRRRRVLLLLDNCEHLAAGCARLAESLLKACPDLHIAATSRVRLGLEGEIVFRVPSLAVPDPTGALSAIELDCYDSVRLFTERSAGYYHGFKLSPSNTAAVAQICWRLDGIPLALELAAASSRLLTAEQIVKQLEDTFQLLAGNSQAALPRHRTLRASIEWSYALLSVKERLLLQRLSVFAEGWSLEAAQAVCDGTEIQTEEVLALLGSLVDHSLVSAEILTGDEARYHLLDTIRQYALECLVQSGEEPAVQLRHLMYFTQLAEQADQGIRGPHQLNWIKRLQKEKSNLSSAMERSFTSGRESKLAVQLACALSWYWGLIGDFISAGHFLNKAVSASKVLGRDPIRALILMRAASTASWGGGFLSRDEMRSYLEESLEIWHELKGAYTLEETQCALVLGWIRKSEFGEDQGLEIMQECQAIFHSLGNLWWEAWADNLIEEVLESTETPKTIYALLDNEAILWKKVGDHWGEAFPQIAWGMYALNQGDFAVGRQHLLESLAIFEACDSAGMAFQAIRDLGHIARILRDYDQAEKYYEKCARLAPEIGWYSALIKIDNARGFVALHQRDDRRAEQLFVRALRKAQDEQWTAQILISILGIGALCAVRNLSDCAARMYGSAMTHMEANQVKPDRVDQHDIDYYFELCRTQCDQETFEQSWAEGCNKTFEQAVSYALDILN